MSLPAMIKSFVNNLLDDHKQPLMNELVYVPESELMYVPESELMYVPESDLDL